MILTICRDSHQKANDKSAEVSCLFTSSVISRVCACMCVWACVWERESVCTWLDICVAEGERERAPICTTTTNKWVWFITSFLLSMNSARPEGLVYTLSSGFSTVQDARLSSPLQACKRVLYAQHVLVCVFMSTQPHVLIRYQILLFSWYNVHLVNCKWTFSIIHVFLW